MDLKRLYEPFELRERPGTGGMKFKYIPSDDVIDRMNQVFDGRWSTTVIKEEKHEDSIVVHVRVCVWDVEDKREYCHDGYGSSQIARYTNGPNKGQAVDIGNAYKGAESKAIRNACTRFGVGLYLEKDAYDMENHVEAFKTESNTLSDVLPDNIPTPESTGQSEPKVKSSSAPMPNCPPVPPAPPIPTVETETKTSSKPKRDVSQQAPAAVDEKPKPSPFPSVPEPKSSPEAKSIPEQPKQAVSAPAPKLAAKADKPTPVQKAALEGMATLTGLGLNKLLELAFENEGMSVDDVPETLDDLTYTQAVAAIKFGSTYKK